MIGSDPLQIPTYYLANVESELRFERSSPAKGDLTGNLGNGMNKRALVVAGAALAALNLTAAAEAANFNNNYEPPYVAVANWSGFYGGVSLGYSDVNASVSVSHPMLGEIGVTGSGGNFTAGLIAGFNWQYGNQVYGIEGDIALPTDFDYLASIRGRYGWISNNWLFYGTAGAAFISTGGSVSGFGFHFDGYNAPGFVFGGGAETKINGNLSPTSPIRPIVTA